MIRSCHADYFVFAARLISLLRRLLMPDCFRYACHTPLPLICHVTMLFRYAAIMFDVIAFSYIRY